MNPDLLSADGAGAGSGADHPALPLVTSAHEFGLPLNELRDLLARDPRACDGAGAPGMIGLENPLIGMVYGRGLAARIGSLLSRPACRFAGAFAWRSTRGASLGAHRDRPGLDVTMSIPLVLDGVDRWPLWWEQPDGDRCEWAGTPGTVLLVDGRQRLHGRGEFGGTLSIVLLLHWTAPLVLRPDFLDEGARRGLAAAKSRLEPGSASGRALLDRCLALARSAVPHSVEPEAAVCDDRQASAAVGALRGRGAAFVVLLAGRAVLKLGDLDAVALRAGDGVAFPAARIGWRGCRLRWPEAGPGKALVGRARRHGRFKDGKMAK